MKLSMDELCRELPCEFRHMLDYLRGLAFHAKPNYDYLRALVQKLRPRPSEADAALPDWLPKIESETTVSHQPDKTKAASRNELPLRM
jgi:hypothetical protein